MLIDAEPVSFAGGGQNGLAEGRPGEGPQGPHPPGGGQAPGLPAGPEGQVQRSNPMHWAVSPGSPQPGGSTADLSTADQEGLHAQLAAVCCCDEERWPPGRQCGDPYHAAHLCSPVC